MLHNLGSNHLPILITISLSPVFRPNERHLSFNFQKAVVVVVITPSLPRDGGTARTAIQVHAVILIEIRRGEDGSPFRTSHEYKLLTGSPTTKKADYHRWVTKSRLL